MKENLSLRSFALSLHKISCTRQFESKPFIALICIIFAAIEYIIRYRYGNEESFCHKRLRWSGILLRQMPEKQRNVFIAISAEGEARSVKSGAFAKKYHLPSPSSVNSAQKGLLEKDFIIQQDDAYVVYDKFFDLWLKKYLK